MSFKRRALAWAISRLNFAQRAMVAEDSAPVVSVDTKHGPIKIWCPAWPVALRVQGFHTKEPDTLAWIDSLEPGIFWDVGANIGVYSLYAAKRGHTVFAFEPSPMNYAVLVKNISINDANVTAYCVAFGDSTGPAVFHAQSLWFGQADAGLHARGPIALATLAYRMDDFPAAAPDYLKIDIDGSEDQLVSGGLRTLAQAKSVQIEVGPGTQFAVHDAMQRAGLACGDPAGSGIHNVRFARTAA